MLSEWNHATSTELFTWHNSFSKNATLVAEINTRAGTDDDDVGADDYAETAGESMVGVQVGSSPRDMDFFVLF